MTIPSTGYYIDVDGSGNLGIYTTSGTEIAYFTSGGNLTLNEGVTLNNDSRLKNDIGIIQYAVNGTDYTYNWVDSSDDFHIATVVGGTWKNVLNIPVDNSGSIKTLNNTLDDGSGNLTATGIIKTGAIQMSTDANGSMEIGSTTASGSPYLDFHSSGNNIDYDLRMQVTGGSSTVGKAALTIYGGSTTVNSTFSTSNSIYPGQGGSTQSVCYIESGTQKITLQADSGNMQIGSNAGTASLNIIGNKISTLDNILDDGSGNMYVAGGLSLTTAGYVPGGVLVANGDWYNALDSGNTARYILGLDTDNILYLRNPSSVSKIYLGATAGVYTTNTNTVSSVTINNTLDDGSGNMTVAGNLTLSSFVASAVNETSYSVTTSAGYVGLLNSGGKLTNNYGSDIFVWCTSPSVAACPTTSGTYGWSCITGTSNSISMGILNNGGYIKNGNGSYNMRVMWIALS